LALRGLFVAFVVVDNDDGEYDGFTIDPQGVRQERDRGDV
jgi:hypothetical protein